MKLLLPVGTFALGLIFLPNTIVGAMFVCGATVVAEFISEVIYGR